MDFSEFLATPITWWAAIAAVLSVIAGWIASRYAKRGVTGFLARVPNVSPAAVRFAGRFAQYTLLFLGIGIGLAFLGANVQPLIAVVVIVLVIVVLVLRGVADNFAASVIIQTRKPVVVGDEITVEGPDGKALTGTIVDLNSRTVVFETVDGRRAHVPNAKMLAETFTNNSRRSARRSEVQVRVERTDVAVDEIVRGDDGCRGIRRRSPRPRRGERAGRLGLARASHRAGAVLARPAGGARRHLARRARRLRTDRGAGLGGHRHERSGNAAARAERDGLNLAHS